MGHPYAEACLIAPHTSKDVATVVKWLGGGNPRGFILDDADKTMIVFDGYGNTHFSMMKFFKLKSEDIFLEFIWQQNGNLSIPDNPKRLSALLNPDQCNFVIDVANKLGCKKPPRFQSWE